MGGRESPRFPVGVTLCRVSTGDAITEAIEQALAAAASMANRAPGFDGVAAYSGSVSRVDDPRILLGSNRWRTFAKIRRRPPVSIATQLRSALFAGVQWDLEANEAGGEAADRGVEIVRRGLLEARLQDGHSWPGVIARAADGQYFTGHAVFATAMGRASDGSMRYTDIAHRPQRTLTRWLRTVDGDDSTPFYAVEQQSSSGATRVLPLSECFYLARKISDDEPDGQGMLAEIAEIWEKLIRYGALEGSELFSSMGGTPMVRVPLEDLRTLAETKHPGDATKIGDYVKSRVSRLYDFVAKRIKHPDIQQWIAVDSATYADPTTGARGGIPKWNLEIIKGEQQGLAEIRKIITDGDLDIARMLGVEFAMVGGGDTAGSFGMHESKISMLGATLSAESWMLARAAEDQLARRLIAANGLDPDTCTPSLVPSPIAVDDVLKATQALVSLNAAGLPRNHPAKRTIFDRLSLPYVDEEEPTLTLPGYGAPSLADEINAAIAKGAL